MKISCFLHTQGTKFPSIVDISIISRKDECNIKKKKCEYNINNKHSNSAIKCIMFIY